MHIIRAADGDSIANLNRALEVNIIPGLAHVHCGHFLIVGYPTVSLLTAFMSLSFYHLLLLVIRLVVAGGLLRVMLLVLLAIGKKEL